MIEVGFTDEIECRHAGLAELYQKITDETISYLKIDNDYILSVTLIDKMKIREINNIYRHLDRVTDVISFAFLDIADAIKGISHDRLLGDIYIAYDVAVDQAREYQHSLERELAFLYLHGLLHLLGYDHQDEATELQMCNIQECILDRLEITR